MTGEAATSAWQNQTIRDGHTLHLYSAYMVTLGILERVHMGASFTFIHVSNVSWYIFSVKPQVGLLSVLHYTLH